MTRVCGDLSTVGRETLDDTRVVMVPGPGVTDTDGAETRGGGKRVVW